MIASVGDVVVLTGLRADPQVSNSMRMPPRVGKVVLVHDNGDLLVKLSLCGWGGRSRFAPRARRVTSANVSRLANKREQALGAVVGEPTGVRAVSL